MASKTRKELEAMSKEDLIKEVIRMQHERTLDDVYNTEMRVKAIASMEEEKKKLLALNAELTKSVQDKGNLLVSDEADTIQLRAKLHVAELERDDAVKMLQRLKQELAATGRVLDGAERYYHAEEKLTEVERNLHNLDRENDRLKDQITYLEMDNKWLSDDIRKVNEWRSSTLHTYLMHRMEVLSKFQVSASSLAKFKVRMVFVNKLIKHFEEGATFIPKHLGGKGRELDSAKFLRSNQAKAVAAGRKEKKDHIVAAGFLDGMDDDEQFMNQETP